jgi:hypothetical protein
MNEPPNNNALSPVEQLANVHDSLADDVFETDIEIDEETSQRATHIVRAAMKEALATGPYSKSIPKTIDQEASPSESSMRSSWWTRHRNTGRFGQIVGLHPATAVVLTAIALVFSAFALGTLGFSTFIEIPVAPLVGLLTWRMQKSLYRDDTLSAFVKALVATALTALPIPLAPFVFIPAGIIGWLQLKTVATQSK